VILNGTTIINNRPLAGCTGGTFWSDGFRPTPIRLQGDHRAVDQRNIFRRAGLRQRAGTHPWSST
jgi:hypothetical protein